MIRTFMSRPVKVVVLTGASIAVAALSAACGTEKIALAPSNPLYQGAVLFQQRCGGCHTLSYAATHGSASNVRSAQYNNGPDFDVRCERPVTRVLYAIENGGFGGAVMPQNVVVGPQAIEVAKFVATYAGRKSPKVPGVLPCADEPIGTIPSTTAVATTASATRAPASTAPSTKSKTAPSRKQKKKATT
jgi:mono/diheme cytochrome c family protein